AVVEVELDKVPAVAAAILTRFAVEDVSIGDVDIEEVVRDLFTQRGA
ncbi:MAG: hypothetical protein HY248_06130, partial [Fimbriimonas ginsengisoli]|nr:hypothetical protein [Fimbriimonas ginsengisoli]